MSLANLDISSLSGGTCMISAQTLTQGCDFFTVNTFSTSQLAVTTAYSTQSIIVATQTITVVPTPTVAEIQATQTTWDDCEEETTPARQPPAATPAAPSPPEEPPCDEETVTTLVTTATTYECPEESATTPAPSVPQPSTPVWVPVQSTGVPPPNNSVPVEPSSVPMVPSSPVALEPTPSPSSPPTSAVPISPPEAPPAPNTTPAPPYCAKPYVDVNVTYPPLGQVGLINVDLGVVISGLLRRQATGGDGDGEKADPIQHAGEDGDTVVHHYRTRCGFTAQGVAGGKTLTARSPGDCVMQCEEAAYKKYQAAQRADDGLSSLGMVTGLLGGGGSSSGPDSGMVDCLGASFGRDATANNCIIWLGVDSDILDASLDALRPDLNVDTFLQ